MGLQGNLKTITLPDVLQWVSTNRKTGILYIHGDNGITKRIFFQDGSICSTASSDPREYLGHFLISRGYLTEEQLDRAMETQMQTGIKLGKVLVTVGILDEEDLKAMLRLKAEEGLYSLFLWKSGDFTFEDQTAIDEDMIHISLDVTSLVMEGVRRTDEWMRIREVIPAEDVVLAATEETFEPGESWRAPVLKRLFQALDGRRSLEEIALDIHSTSFQISEAAFALCKEGAAKVVGRKKPREEAAYTKVQRSMLQEAAKALEDKRYEEALRLYGYLQKVMPGDEEVAKGLSLAELGASKEFFEREFPMDTVLELAVPVERLARVSLTPEEGYIVSRVNGSWDVASIVKISPMIEREVLAALRRLLKKGVVRAGRRKGA